MFGIISIYRMATWRISSLALCGCAVFGCIVMISGCGKTLSTDVTQAGTGDDSTKTIRDLDIASTLSLETAAAPPSVAVIDVNEVARQMGTADMISAMVDDKENALQQNFRALQQRFMLEYNAAATQIGSQPTQEQEADLLSLQQRHMDQLSAEWNRIQQETGDFHDELKKQFVDSVRPVAAAVARSKNIPTVLTSGQVFSAEDNCDITDEVAEAMKQILRDAARQAQAADAAAKLR